MVRDHLARFGDEIKSTGDGFVATFDGPGRACQCAMSLTRAVAGVGLDIRAGLHTGEVELVGDDIAGMAVHAAARIMAAAEPGKVFTSGTVIL